MRSPNDCAAPAFAGFSELGASETLRVRAEENLRRWLEDGKFAEARPQLESLMERGCTARLFDAFFREIPFGTGGRRGPVGYGPNRINPFTVSTSAQGHATFLGDRFARLAEISVVLAYDVRVFNDLRGVYDPRLPNPLLGVTSRDFARLAACVYAANGIQVWMPDPSQDRYWSTPELSFAIRSLQAQGGLNISASHNHPDDNGAKVYNDRGSQEIAPVDAELAKIVEATAEAKTMDFAGAVSTGLIRWIPREVTEAYIETNLRISRNRQARSTRVVFTPLHGTGDSSAGTVLRRSGFAVDVYQAQATLDGTFPTVPFRSPNPEVRESLGAAVEHARQTGADLVLGTDPDADRIGMVAPDGDRWVFFDGNEIAVVLAHYLFASGASAGMAHPFATTTAVTTSLVGRIARAAGVELVDDLAVGFKYVARLLNDLESSGRHGDLEASLDDFLLAAEESHGYLVTPAVRDKDAAGAALLLAEIASLLKEEGRSFVEHLDGIYRDFGFVKNLLLSNVMTGPEGLFRIRKIQENTRAAPPTEVAGRKVLERIDRWDETGRFGPILSDTDRMSRDMITLILDGGARLTLRPSGTESKNKVYVEVAGQPLGPDTSPEELESEKARLGGEAARIAGDFTRTMLAQVGLSLPDHALAVSDLVPVEYKQDFAERFLPELRRRLEDGQGGEKLDAWVDARLAPYGADGRLLVASGIRKYLATEKLPEDIAAWMRESFGGDRQEAEWG